MTKKSLDSLLARVRGSLFIDKKPKEAIFLMSQYLQTKYWFITFSDTKEIYVYLKGVYVPRGEEFISYEVQDIFKKESGTHRVNEIMNHIRRETYVERKSVKEPIDRLCLENGILNLLTLRVQKHSPKIVFLNKIPVSYKKKAKCPKIMKFLSEIVKEDDVILLQELIGYCLIKSHMIHKSFMLVGSGSNGKSCFLNLIKYFLGVENISAIPLHSLEYNRFALSSLYGKMANIFADLSDKALTGTSIFKMLVGEDQIPAEMKFKNQFFFQNYSKQIFSANKVPRSPEDSDAFFRRWIIVNFPNQFMEDKADKHLIKKITTSDELSGLLLFAIEGLKRLLNNGDFSNTKSLQDVREQYIRMSDSVHAFVMDCCLASPDKYVAKKELYVSYCDYCRIMSYPIEAENMFHRGLQKHIRCEDYRPSLEVDGKRIRTQCWKGIHINLYWKLNPDNPDQENLIVDDKKKSVRVVNPSNPINLFTQENGNEK